MIIEDNFKIKIQEIHALDVLVKASFTEYLHNKLPALQKSFLEMDPSIKGIEELDSRAYFAGDGKPEDADKIIYLTEYTQGDVKNMLKKDGELQNKVRQYCIVSLYHLWEEFYRHEFAKHYGVDYKSISWDIMGEVKNLRNAIIHNNGVADKKVEEAKILKWFKNNEDIVLSEKMYSQLVEKLNNIDIYISTTDLDKTNR